jgi:NAD(P)-dependent dehydrogenase (short-subunit alcohol dehydrogenase family)
MKIVVIGGTGLIGSELVNKLRGHGQEAAAAALNTGVNTLTGEGLAEVLKGASVVVDVSNSPSWEDVAVMKFFDQPDQTPKIDVLESPARDRLVDALVTVLADYLRIPVFVTFRGAALS